MKIIKLKGNKLNQHLKDIQEEINIASVGMQEFAKIIKMKNEVLWEILKTLCPEIEDKKNKKYQDFWRFNVKEMKLENPMIDIKKGRSKEWKQHQY